MIKAIFKLIASSGVIFGFLSCAAVTGLITRDPARRRQKAMRWASRFSRLFLKIHGIEVESQLSAVKLKPGTLVVSNHLSYLDIPVLLSVLENGVFITSNDMAATPVLGWMCRLAGCFTVERRRTGKGMREEIQKIGDALDQQPLICFPEATSTDGRGVRKFFPAMFSALRAGQTCQPLVVQVNAIGDQTFQRENADFYCWYGDMGFGSHLWALAKNRGGMKVTLKQLDELPIAGEVERKVLANAAYERIAGAFEPALG